MPEAIDVVCPCCDAKLKVDPETAAVIWVEQKKGKAHDFDELALRVASQKSSIDEKFARSVQQTKHAKDILDRKFEEARRRAAESPATKVPHPFDND